jgi:hypothetical protein
MFKYLILLCLVFIVSCSGKNTKVEIEKKKNIEFKANLFNPIYLTSLFEAPNNFGPIWSKDAIELLKINKISLFIKGGKYKNNISEKLSYTFNSNGNTSNFNHYLYNLSLEPFSTSGFTFDPNGALEKIDVFKYMQFGNIPPSFLKRDSTKTTVITPKNSNDFDSLIFYPNIENPKLIVEIVNHKVNSIEVFVEKGANLEKIQSLSKTLDSTLKIFEFSEKSVTFLENNLPQESFHLDSKWHKQEQSKKWEYNENQQVIKYIERLHGTLIKNIEITYDVENLPAEFVVDRKRFVFYSRTK